ncbi:T9SS type A sorting domain-containing protein [Flavilitoribacter nigricans]|uniref:Secretion system C-terminal sorting domain-containing protein n=1 Tax=Flavilitoribacter nigricans (strain ATCC 23147 / DSM 23189 / NBRC 102662 / NCIMB 1420 / SS-2) TaxID=1122177 RepID=A0A2D0NGH8_FLAN2|nr:T9SS type A sorting domain-containing protein [Flavilitoribacter nigricans]PHN07601.1 hypothetical protein CRP01_05735 [Flavilitoribacter nigricans DSM 23189 = NBRC 102662]
MRKLSTLLLSLLLATAVQSQNCTVFGSDFASNFIACANDPATVSITFGPPLHPAGYGTVSIEGMDPAVDLSGLTIYVPDKIRLVFTGNIIIDASTNFLGTGGVSGNSEVQFGEDGTVYKANRGLNSFVALNQLIAGCAQNPDPMECLELVSFLPVELTAFQGAAREDMIELNWSTATELNNDYFEIEHSKDGFSFNTVGKIKGAGTTTEEVQYQFLHRQPVSGTNYYRLRQVDYDGKFEYSDLIAVEMELRDGGVKVYPNPTVDRAVIQLDERPERVEILLTNILGQRIDLIPRVNDLGWEINLGELQAGIYLLRVEANGKTITKQIVKR